MNFKNFSRAQFSKLRNGINGVGEFRYDTICSQHFVSIALLVWKLLGRPKLYTDRHTHKHTHTHTYTHTHTHTHTLRSVLQVLFFCENAETRPKIIFLHVGFSIRTIIHIRALACLHNAYIHTCMRTHIHTAVVER